MKLGTAEGIKLEEREKETKRIIEQKLENMYKSHAVAFKTFPVFRTQQALKANTE